MKNPKIYNFEEWIQNLKNNNEDIVCKNCEESLLNESFDCYLNHKKILNKIYEEQKNRDLKLWEENQKIF